MGIGLLLSKSKRRRLTPENTSLEVLLAALVELEEGLLLLGLSDRGRFLPVLLGLLLAGLLTGLVVSASSSNMAFASSSS